MKSITSHLEDDNRILRYRWSTLIKKVYADPLICPNCGGRMKIIAFIKKKLVIEHILKHLGLLDELPHAHSPPPTEPSKCDVTYEPRPFCPGVQLRSRKGGVSQYLMTSRCLNRLSYCKLHREFRNFIESQIPYTTGLLEVLSHSG